MALEKEGKGKDRTITDDVPKNIQGIFTRMWGADDEEEEPPRQMTAAWPFGGSSRDGYASLVPSPPSATPSPLPLP